MAGTYVMTLKLARRVLQSILDERKEIREKTVIQIEALNLGARALERAVENGALLQREAAIMRYHASHDGAHLFTDKLTRRALERAIARLDREIVDTGDDANE